MELVNCRFLKWKRYNDSEGEGVIMKTIIIILCLGLMGGCATTPKHSKNPCQAAKKLQPAANVKYISPKELDNIILIFDETLKKNPKYAGAYYYRAVAYFYKKDYKRSWQDVHMAESLGYTFKDSFIRALKKASGSEK